MILDCLTNKAKNWTKFLVLSYAIGVYISGNLI